MEHEGDRSPIAQGLWKPEEQQVCKVKEGMMKAKSTILPGTGYVQGCGRIMSWRLILGGYSAYFVILLT